MREKKRGAVTEISAFYAAARKSDSVTVNARDFYSLTYRYSGKITVETEKSTLVSGEKSVTFIPKGLSYKTEILDDMRMAVVHFKLDRDIDFRNAATVSVDHAGIPLLFEKLISVSHTDRPVDFHAMATFYELLSRLEELSGREDARRMPEKIHRARKSIERRYADPDLSVAMLAESLDISTSYLRREFSRAYGVSPIAFLRDVRVANAKNLLEAGVLSVGEIAEQCGFGSMSYFIQVFHKAAGESPDRYRRSYIDKK